MLSVDDARRVAADWRPRFTDETEFELSWSRYMDSATVPDISRLEAWLAKDLAKSEVSAPASLAEPLLPVRQTLPDGCYHCHGFGYVRDLSWSPDPSVCGPSHPAFGRAIRCPACRDPHHRCDQCTP